MKIKDLVNLLIEFDPDNDINVNYYDGEYTYEYYDFKKVIKLEQDCKEIYWKQDGHKCTGLAPVVNITIQGKPLGWSSRSQNPKDRNKKSE